jgi:FAD:protein FMN transferase
MRAAFATMGTMVSIVLAAPTDLAPVEDLFRGLDETFSLYEPASALSRIARGELALSAASEDVRSEYARALDWRAKTSGWFTPHRPDGIVDLSGTIKAVALMGAASLLAAQDAVGAIGAGGDLVALGGADPTVGIIDPHDRHRLLTSVALTSRRAVATSGIAERGDHIWSAAGASDLAQVTVMADDIVEADVLATAIMAAGSAHRDELTTRADIDVLTVDRSGAVCLTPGFRIAVAAAVPGRVDRRSVSA